MRRIAPELTEHFEEKARDDPGYAIAFALVLVAEEMRRYREEMTFGSQTGANRYPGIGEKIGMELANIAEQLGSISSRLPD